MVLNYEKDCLQHSVCFTFILGQSFFFRKDQRGDKAGDLGLCISVKVSLDLDP